VRLSFAAFELVKHLVSFYSYLPLVAPAWQQALAQPWHGSDSYVLDDGKGWPQGMARATVLNMLKHDVSTQCHEVVLEALRICGMAGYRNGTEFSIGRHLRDILSAQLMINNDRIASGTGAMLFAQRAELGTL
jgi:acyl-CoA dehydrogenase